MKLQTLRNYIPISGPATREPCRGDDAFIRPSVGFTPQWYRDRLGIDFSEIWHTDPRYRYESLCTMKSYLHERFPAIQNFTPLKGESGIDLTCATISGVYGIMLMAGIYGIEISYQEDQWPDASNSSPIPKEVLKGLPPFSEEYLLQNQLVRELFRQMDDIEDTWGRIHGYLNYQGILNVAVKIAGSDVFIDMVLEPDYVHRLLGHIAQTILTLSKMVQRRQRESGFDVDLLTMSNCTVSMISPDQYRTFVLPLDIGLSNQYSRFGIHTCNWIIDPYLDVLRDIKKMGYLDTGMHSDLPRVRRMFPDTRRAVLYTPGEIESRTLDEIHDDIDRVRREYAPCDLVLADIDSSVSDSKMADVLSCVEEMSVKGEDDEAF